MLTSVEKEPRYFVLKWSPRKPLYGASRYEVRPMTALDYPEPEWWTVVDKDLTSNKAFEIVKRLQAKGE